MARLPIVQENEPVLRATAQPVPDSLFGTTELKKIVADMTETLGAEPDGVALAAPQVGISYRIFIVRYDRMLPPPPQGAPERSAEIGVFINPQLMRLSRRTATLDEGCLSVRNIYGKTRRRERATVRAFDENGTPFERGAGGMLAQAFQHETDHLNGILFIDHADELVEWHPEPETATQGTP